MYEIMNVIKKCLKPISITVWLINVQINITDLL